MKRLQDNKNEKGAKHKNEGIVLSGGILERVEYYIHQIIMFLAAIFLMVDIGLPIFRFSLDKIFYGAPRFGMLIFQSIFFDGNIDWLITLIGRCIIFVFCLIIVYYLFLAIRIILKKSDIIDNSAYRLKFNLCGLLISIIFLLVRGYMLKNYFSGYEIATKSYVIISSLIYSYLIYWFICYIKETKNKIDEFIDEGLVKIREVDYVILFITLLSITFIMSAMVLSETFHSELPKNEICANGGNISCKSNNGYYNYVDGRYITCVNSFNQNFSGKGVIRLANKTNEWKTEDLALNKNNVFFNKDNLTQESIKINKDEYIVMIYYQDINETKIEECFFKDEQRVYTYEEYLNKEKEKAQWFLGVIMFSFFTILSGVANLKEILRKDEKKEDKKKEGKK